MNIIFFAIFLILTVVGCREKKKDPPPPYAAQVLVLNTAERADLPATYSLGDRSFSTLESLEKLEGRYFSVVYGGELSISDVEGSQVSKPSFKGGKSPLLRYNIEEGAIVPRDYTTLALLSAFYQLEQVFLNLESLLGVAADTFLSINGKMKVLFEPSIVLRSGDTSAEVVIKLNAAYVPGDKQFVLFRRSAVEEVPIGLNLQVIAHEFGHAAFEQAFFKNQFDECSRFAREHDIKGINEGFADVLSWASTGSADVLRGSFSIPEIADARNFSNLKFSYDDLFDNFGTEEKKCDGGIYCIGTLFASGILKAHQRMSRTNSFADRSLTMRAVYDSLAKAQETMNQYPVWILPEKPASDCEADASSPSFLPNGPTVLGAFLTAFIQNSPAEMQQHLCSAMLENFGNSGFPIEARAEVCQ